MSAKGHRERGQSLSMFSPSPPLPCRTRDRKVAFRYLEGAAGAFSSAGLTFCAESSSVSVPSPCYLSGTQKSPVILPKVQWQVTPKHAYTVFMTQRSRSELTMLSRQPIRETSSHATCQRTLCHCRLSWAIMISNIVTAWNYQVIPFTLKPCPETLRLTLSAPGVLQCQKCPEPDVCSMCSDDEPSVFKGFKYIT